MGQATGWGRGAADCGGLHHSSGSRVGRSRDMQGMVKYTMWTQLETDEAVPSRRTHKLTKENNTDKDTLHNPVGYCQELTMEQALIFFNIF